MEFKIPYNGFLYWINPFDSSIDMFETIAIETRPNLKIKILTIGF